MYEFVNFHLLPGLILGCIYALGAIGITLTFGILRFANFAHGETMTLGAYLTLVLVEITNSQPLLMLPIAMCATALVVLLIDRYCYRPLRSKETIYLVIASFGMMLMLRSLIQLIWGTQIQSLEQGIQKPYILYDFLRLSPNHLLIFCTTLILVIAVHLLLSKTKIGKAMRAVSDAPELARLTGIDSERVIKITWILGASLATAAGVYLALDTYIDTLMGFKVLLPIFTAAILGGIGRPYGAMIGGVIIGLIEELSTYPWIGDSPLVPPGYKTAITFLIMIVLLIFRPSGLLRGKVL